MTEGKFHIYKSKDETWERNYIYNIHTDTVYLADPNGSPNSKCSRQTLPDSILQFFLDYQSKINFLITRLSQIFCAFLQRSNALMTILSIMVKYESNLQ